jgi:hypothetical protein
VIPKGGKKARTIMEYTRFVNADTMCALQIFENESHPNLHMQSPHGYGKEGLSLFGNTQYIVIVENLKSAV